MSFRQMLPFLLLNVIVSTVVVLSILFWWDNRGGTILPEPTAEVAQGGQLPTPNIAAPPSGTIPAEAQPVSGAAEPVIHTVQAGETLMRISQQYDVSIDDILLVNGLTDPNVIAVGQQLTIPVGGIPTPTTAPPTAPAALPSPIPAETITTGQGVIGVTGVVDPGVLATEAVQIVNSGTATQLMQGWKLRDDDGNVYVFGDVRIFGEGAGVLLHTGPGDDSPTELFWGKEEPVWRSGETLTLWDGAEQLITTFVVP